MLNNQTSNKEEQKLVWHEIPKRTVCIIAEHGKVTLSGDFTDEKALFM